MKHSDTPDWKDALEEAYSTPQQTTMTRAQRRAQYSRPSRSKPYMYEKKYKKRSGKVKQMSPDVWVDKDKRKKLGKANIIKLLIGAEKHAQKVLLLQRLSKLYPRR